MISLINPWVVRKDTSLIHPFITSIFWLQLFTNRNKLQPFRGFNVPLLKGAGLSRSIHEMITLFLGKKQNFLENTFHVVREIKTTTNVFFSLVRRKRATRGEGGNRMD